jgi:hypothetical protein
MFPSIEPNIIQLYSLHMDIFSEHMDANSIQNDSNTTSSTDLHGPQIGLEEPECSMSLESEYFDEEDMYAASYDNESVHSGLDSDSDFLSDSDEMCYASLSVVRLGRCRCGCNSRVTQL